jgi:aldehyde dehydrogenase (NAD+)
MISNLHTDKFYIDGQWQPPSAQSDYRDVINPATERTIARIAMGSSEDINIAVEAAQRAFKSFAKSSKTERLELLNNILAVFEQRYDDMSEVICAELGAPISLCQNAQTAVGIGHLKATITTLENYHFEQVNSEGDLILREPIGVCGLITPWNWPINQIALKVFPALAAGCTMVLKPSEMTPLNALLFTEIIDAAGVPPGVFNLVNGDGQNAGASLSKHPDIQMISFTGSTRAGSQISKDSAATVKRVALELGGKSPNIILPDADLKAAVTKGVGHCFQNTGQSCNAPTRMLVHQDQYEQAMAIAAEAAQKTTVGPPDQTGKHLGPLVSATQYSKVQALMQTAIDEGATLLAGGPGRPEGFDQGYYVKPTVFGNVTNDMTIAQEEVFGPVLVIIPFTSDEQAIAIANDTPYGLAAYIQSKDQERALGIMRELRAGMVRINGTDIGYSSPFGGYKLSGNGREGGSLGLEDFCEIKAVSLPQLTTEN